MIFQPPDDYTDLRDIAPKRKSNQNNDENAEEQQQEYISQDAVKRVEDRKLTLQRLFLILLGTGLVVGAILAVGVLVLLNRLDVMFEPDATQEQISPPAPAQEILYRID